MIALTEIIDFKATTTQIRGIKKVEPIVKTQWIKKLGFGGKFKVGNIVKQFSNYGKIIAVQKDFQDNIDTGCPYYLLKIKWNDISHWTYGLTYRLKLVE